MAIEETMSARRYAELLEIAKAASETYQLTQNKPSSDDIKFSSYQCEIIAVIFSISALEAFINHLGYILDNDWKSFERKNFWDQYDRVINILKTLQINIDKISKSPYEEFENFRDKIRNPTHHPHASKHDTQYSKYSADSMDEISSFKKDHQILFNSWLTISPENGMLCYNKTKEFINKLHQEFKENMFYDLTETISLIKYEIPNLEERQALLRRFNQDPFNPHSIILRTLT